MGIQAEEAGDPLVAAVTDFERFQPGVEAALFFVEQAEEQHDGRLQFVGYFIGGDRAAGQLWTGLPQLPVEQLALELRSMDRTVQIHATDKLA